MLGDSSSHLAGADPAYHVPVLSEQVLANLLADVEGVFVDGTVGGGGHAALICSRLTGRGRLIGFDADEDALAAAARVLSPFAARVRLVRANFRALGSELRRLGETGLSGVLLDLGVSSHQFDQGERGFSFRADDKLDMRMDRRQGVTALEVLNTYSEERLAEVIYRYGEEHASRRIARRIADARPIETTGALADAVQSAVGRGPASVKSLARVFQAIRIEVNDELESLTRVLPAALAALRPGGRLVVISYHSLEDRIVKNFFRTESADSIRAPHKLLPDTPRVPLLRILTRRPVTADDEETERNPRARSAKLRAAERLGGAEGGEPGER